MFAVKFEDDLYVIDEIYQDYLCDYWNEASARAIHFNHASITPPLPFIHRAAAEICKEKLSTNSTRRMEIIEETRRSVANLVNVGKECVVFANNTTDAASLVFWLAGLRERDTVLTTDAENESIPRIFRYYMDHANPGDGWVSWQNFAQDSNSRPGLIKKRETGVLVKMIPAYGVNDREFLDNLLMQIDDSTKLVVFCHVLRENGRIMPVKEICKAIHDTHWNIQILVDGAQCLGTLPRIDLEELGCDYYVATPHKTLNTETVGLLFINPNQLDLCSRIKTVPAEKQIIKKDQFSNELRITSNSEFAVSLPEVYALGLVIDYYREEGWLIGNDFSKVDRHLRNIKVAMVKRMGEQEAQIASPLMPRITNFICSFRFQSLDNKKLAAKLWRDRIFLSYIHRPNVLRASFSIMNSSQEVEAFASALRRLIPQTS